MAGNYRMTLPLFQLFRSRYPRLTDSATDICIEGYPRSGNTYFVSAFLMWNRGINVAHHSHLAGSMKRAINKNVPTVLLIRNPTDSVTSVLAWDGKLNVTIALASYAHFYRQLWKYRSQILILRFEDVIQRPDECVQLINSRFGQKFAATRFNPSVDQQIKARLEKVDSRHERSHLNSTLPNAAKIDLKLKYANQLVNSRLFTNAQSIYVDYKLLAVRPDGNVSLETNKT